MRYNVLPLDTHYDWIVEDIHVGFQFDFIRIDNNFGPFLNTHFKISSPRHKGHGWEASYSHMKTLITISNDKDLKRMIKFHGNSGTTEIYVMTEEAVDPDFSNMPGSRSSRTTLSEMAVPVEAPLSVMEDIVDDPNEPGLLLDVNFDVVGDTNNVDDTIEIAAEMPVPVSFAAANYDEKNVKAALQWQNDITGVGQRGVTGKIRSRGQWTKVVQLWEKDSFS
ncbi:hypothetical protein K7X08_036503 [Anisodus acutangulus]|uniref:Uncharacterized protein n=1 Tax=Anisodus acutangulus TaxID=402998 RepID=A0A9Q1L915_9SOLA|nr:hypothetical protein K7X08_036503 [Anisodus acutangulus]